MYLQLKTTKFIALYKSIQYVKASQSDAMKMGEAPLYWIQCITPPPQFAE